MQAFAAAVLELQEKRHSADYDPSIRVKTSDAILAISTARSALNRFVTADPSRREAFLGLLLFRPGDVSTADLQSRSSPSMPTLRRARATSSLTTGPTAVGSSTGSAA